MPPRVSTRGTGTGTGTGSSISTRSRTQQSVSHPQRNGVSVVSTPTSRAVSVVPSKSPEPSMHSNSLAKTTAFASSSRSGQKTASSSSGRTTGVMRQRPDTVNSDDEDEGSFAIRGRLVSPMSDDEDDAMGLQQELVSVRKADEGQKKVSKGKMAAGSDLEERLRIAEETVKKMRSDLEEQQNANLTLRREIVKRTHEEAAEEAPKAKKPRTSDNAPKKDNSKAYEQGKQMAALYCPFGSRRMIFGALQRLLNGAEPSKMGGENEEEDTGDEANNGDTFEQFMDRPEAASANKTTPDGTYDFFEPSDQSAYIEDTASIFWEDVPREDLEGWETRDYQSRFMEGMSRGRSSFKSDTEQAELVFGFQIRQATFAKKSTRAELPEVADLLENTMFLSEGSVDRRIYRHPCLSQARSSLPPAPLPGVYPSKKARSTYQEQWGVKSMSIELLAWTATVATHILTGDEELNQSQDIRDIFWKQLYFLTEIKNKGGAAYEDLIKFYDTKLGLLPTDSRGNRLKTAEEELLAKILGR